MEHELSRNPTEMELFHHFISYRVANGGARSTVNEAVEDFHEYQRQYHDFKAKLREAEVSDACGESRPIDIDEFLTELNKEWKLLGIPE